MSVDISCLQEYANALAQYSLQVADNTGDGDMNLFHAYFGPPRLEFVCNHNVILHLKIKEAEYHLDYNRNSELSSASL